MDKIYRCESPCDVSAWLIRTRIGFKSNIELAFIQFRQMVIMYVTSLHRDVQILPFLNYLGIAWSESTHLIIVYF
jgi:hypothetical protein